MRPMSCSGTKAGANRRRRSHPFFARFYRLLSKAMESGPVGRLRHDLLSEAYGRVLEIGAGTGANQPHYPPTSRLVVLSEPDAHMRGYLLKALARSKTPRETSPKHVVVAATAEALPFADSCFDTVVATLTFCSLDDPQMAAAEIHRVLRPGGKLLTFEHVRSARLGVATAQRLLTPLWKRLAGNCHLDRATEQILKEAGLISYDSEYIHTRYVPPVLSDHLFGTFEKPSQSSPEANRESVRRQPVTSSAATDQDEAVRKKR